MKEILFISTLVFSCTAFAQNKIPVQFHGLYEGNKATCGREPIMYDYSDNGFDIGAEGISGFEEGCGLEKALSQSELSFTGSFSCGGPDESETVKVTLTLSPDKKTITTSSNKSIVAFGNGKYYRCK